MSDFRISDSGIFSLLTSSRKVWRCKWAIHFFSLFLNQWKILYYTASDIFNICAWKLCTNQTARFKISWRERLDFCHEKLGADIWNVTRGTLNIFKYCNIISIILPLFKYLKKYLRSAATDSSIPDKSVLIICCWISKPALFLKKPRNAVFMELYYFGTKISPFVPYALVHRYTSEAWNP